MDPTKKELYTAKRPSGLNVSDPAINEAFNALRSDENKTSWVVLSVRNSTELFVHGVGEGDISALISTLSDDDVFFGFFRCLVQGKIKFYGIFYVGENVGGMKKGKASLFKSSVFGLTDIHGEISGCSGLAEFTSQFVNDSVAKLASCTAGDVTYEA